MKEEYGLEELAQSHSFFLASDFARQSLHNSQFLNSHIDKDFHFFKMQSD